MTRVRTVIAEDEGPARERLIALCASMPILDVVSVAVTGAQALEAIRTHTPDLAFLDIQMPVMNGFEVLSRLETIPHVIFTTAFDDYAIQAFEVHAVDYLLKPYGKKRFETAVSRAVARIEANVGDEEKLRTILRQVRVPQEYLRRLSIREGHSYRVIDVSSVDCFKAEEGLVFVLSKGQKHVVDTSLSQLEEELDPNHFLRIHRNAIANLSRIERVIPWGQGQLSVALPGGEKLFVSRSHVDEFRKVMGLRF